MKNVKRSKFFFLNGNLYRLLYINRSSNMATAWNYIEHKREAFIWTDLRKRWERAYTLTEVCKLLNRTRAWIEHYFVDGTLRRPPRVYTLDGRRAPGKYMFSEEHILELHDFFLTQHIGRPRDDGRVLPGRGLPSRVELIAKMRHDAVVYVKNSQGEFVPVWKEESIW